MGFSAGALFLQRLSDRWVPWKRTRWSLVTVLLPGFVLHVCMTLRHIFVAYILAIYLLNQLILFISPVTDDDECRSGEYRPFVRALSEFRLWARITCATSIASI